MKSEYTRTTDPTEWSAIARGALGIDPEQAYVDVERCLSEDLSIRVERIALPGLAGLLILRNPAFDGSVLVQQGDSLDRQRFTIAHELKHILIDVESGVLRAQDGLLIHPDPAESLGAGLWSNRTDIETTADQFASEFLISTGAFEASLNAKQMSVSALAEIGSVFGVSLTASATKWACCSKGRCALVEVREGRLYRFVASPTFLSQPKSERWFSVGTELSAKTRAAARARGELELGLSGPNRIMAREWFKGARAKQELCEDVFEVQKSGRLYTVLWYPEDF